MLSKLFKVGDMKRDIEKILDTVTATIKDNHESLVEFISV